MNQYNQLTNIKQYHSSSSSYLPFWHHHSPSFRWFLLSLALFIPFGGHVLKYSLSGIASEMLADQQLQLSHTYMGMFQSAVSIPNLFIPFLGGIWLDFRSTKTGM